MEDPRKHFVILDLALMRKTSFLEHVRIEARNRAETTNRSAFVFVHGFNVSFPSALYRTAQMAHDLEFDGIPFLYSWPSRGGVDEYVADRNNAEQALPYLRQFLDMVIRESGAEQVHIIAHSMGSMPIMRVLNELSATLAENDKHRVRQIVLAAPDVDPDIFEQLARAMSTYGGATVYASSNDRALTVSKFVGGSGEHVRMGSVGSSGPLIVTGIDTIDASTASMDWFSLNHSGYAESEVLLTDIALLFKCGIRPPSRRWDVFEEIAGRTGVYWKLRSVRSASPNCAP